MNFSELGRQWSFRVVYADILYTVVTFILPFLVLAVFSLLLLRVYRAQRRRRAAMRTPRGSRGNSSTSASTATSTSNEHSVTRVIVVVMVVFAVCNLPAKVFDGAYDGRPDCGTVAYVARRLSFVLEVANSAANFVVYCALRHQFRDGLRRALSPLQRQSRRRADTDSGGGRGGRGGAGARRHDHQRQPVDNEQLHVLNSQRVVDVEINEEPVTGHLAVFTPTSVRIDENTL